MTRPRQHQTRRLATPSSTKLLLWRHTRMPAARQGKRSRPILELMFCSVLTILPDYLFRRYVQGKRIGKDITLYSVWFELRWGITSCLILTILLITTIFYNHPATSSVTLYFRTVPILPETNGRVAKIYVDYSAHVEKGAPIFKLDSSKQQAAVETARRKIAEVEADLEVAKLDIAKSTAE